MNYAIMVKGVHLLPAFLKCTEYEEAISNGKKLKLFNDLDKSIGNWRKVDSILKRVLNTDTPKLSWYRTELQRYIEFKRGKGRLSDLCSGLEKKFEQMKNEKVTIEHCYI